MAVVLLLGSGWWLTHADELPPVGNEWAITTTVGQPVLFGVLVDPDRTIALRTVRARVRSNTADAVIRVLICTGLQGNEIGVDRARATDLCASLPTLRGQRLLPLPGAGPRLVVEVVPRRTGQVVIEGVSISYRAGLRRGSENTGSRMLTTVS